MEPFDDPIADHQRQALDFMLDALGLQGAREEAHRTARLLELKDRSAALLRENQRLRRHIAELKQKIAETQSMVAALEHLARHCHGDERPECPILDDLAR